MPDLAVVSNSPAVNVATDTDTTPMADRLGDARTCLGALAKRVGADVFGAAHGTRQYVEAGRHLQKAIAKYEGFIRALVDADKDLASAIAESQALLRK